MADSVTPPPSPFGKPAAAAPVEQKPLLVGLAKTLEGETYGGRFRFAYVALALVVGAAVAVLAVVLVQGRAPSGPRWSAWKPSAGARLDVAAAIAGHVAPLYRLTVGGAELVAVQAHTPEIQNVPVEAVVVRGASGSNQDYKITSTKNSIAYVLCGLGTRCAITSGTPTVARARLLRREALELALYTFEYDGGVDSVIALLPPPPKDSTVNWALFFRKSDFRQELSQPLSRTLPQPLKGKLSPQSVVGNSDQQTVEKLTRPYWYTSQFQQLQDGNAVLVLDPLIAAS